MKHILIIKGTIRVDLCSLKSFIRPKYTRPKFLIAQDLVSGAFGGRGITTKRKKFTVILVIMLFFNGFVNN